MWVTCGAQARREDLTLLAALCVQSKQPCCACTPQPRGFQTPLHNLILHIPQLSRDSASCKMRWPAAAAAAHLAVTRRRLHVDELHVPVVLRLVQLPPVDLAGLQLHLKDVSSRLATV